MTLAFARFDLQSWLPRTQTLLPLAFVVVVGIALPVPGMAIVASAFVTSLVLSAPFLGDERGRLDTLYGLLPIARRSVVLGRSLAVLAFAVMAAVIASLTTIVVAMVRGAAISGEGLLLAHAVAFAVVGLSMSLQLPVFFRIGYSRGRLMAYAPTLVIAGLAWLAQALDLVAFDDLAPASLTIVSAACLAFGALGIVVGVIVSTRLYEAREIR